jgi:hypothetical protein
MDFDPKSKVEIYDPFRPYDSLGLHKPQGKEIFQEHLNRIHKINRFRCRDNHTSIIADNRLALFPHYKNILINKNTANQNLKWLFGMR